MRNVDYRHIGRREQRKVYDERVPRRPRRDDAEFSGVAYVSGVKTTGLNSDGAKPYVKVDIGTNTVTEDAGPPPDPFPAHQEWYEKAYTFGDIHITRF